MDAHTDFNHIALLQHRAKTSGDTVLLRLPALNGSEHPREWNTLVTIAEFAAEVDRVAGYFLGVLSPLDVPFRSVVSFLYGGRKYEELLYLVALSRAGYIPQLLSSEGLASPSIIADLMDQAESRAIFFDPQVEHLTANCQHPKFPLGPVKSLDAQGDHLQLPSIHDLSTGPDDNCLFFLTSGSTSGRPKLVPYTQGSTSIYYKSQFGIWLADNKFDSQDIFISRGSVCSVAGVIQYLGCLYTRSSIIYPSKARFTTTELVNLINFGGLNRLTSYGTYLAPHIHAAKTDPAILKLLQSMRTISYGGVPISSADDDWCFQNGVPMMDMYATTECGLLMVSIGPSKPARYMRPVPGLAHTFEPIDLSADNSFEHTASQLYEFVLSADSGQIPAPHLCSPDGTFHSGDIFERFEDGSYLLRGRDDDWIKTFSADRTDAKAIEEKVYELCGDLIKECIVVGDLRPTPSLFVTTGPSHDTAQAGLKESILERLKDFTATQYVHEKITDKQLIFVVDEDALPRTSKGNLRRTAIEHKYKSELNMAYKAVYVEH